MASPYNYPPQPPVPPQPPQPPVYRERRSMAGPLILILIGLLFLLKNVGVHIPVWHFFGRYWPVLLIVWGVIAIIEHEMAYRQGYRRRYLGAGGIILLILLVCLGLTAHFTSDTDWSGLRSQMEMDDDLGGLFGTAYNFDQTVEHDFPAKGSLRVVCDHGSLNFSPSDDGKLRVVVHKKLYAGSQSDANDYDRQTQPQITVTGTTVLLDANTHAAGEHGVNSDMDIFLPREAMVDVAGRYGDVNVTDRKNDVKIAWQHGDVTLADITGAAKIALEKGSIRATQVSGDVDVDGRVDNVTLDDIAGAVHLSGEFFDDIRLSKIAKTVTFKSSRSDVQVASIPGSLEIDDSDVRGDDVTGPTRVITRSKNITVQGVTGDLQLQTTNGDVEVGASGGKQPLGKMNITTEHGDVTLTLPSGAGFQMNATTRKGDISSDFESLKVSESGGESTATGTVGNGVSKLQINADTGSIRISKS